MRSFAALVLLFGLGTACSPGDGSLNRDDVPDHQVAGTDSSPPPGDPTTPPADNDGPGDGDGLPTTTDGSGDGGDSGGNGDAGPMTFERCFAEITAPGQPAPDYAQFGPVLGDHCSGTNHQQIADIERVVFLGDSVTVGSPPTAAAEVYRALLAKSLATAFGLEAPSVAWNYYNPLSGEATLRDSGDFSSCARWGARADDLMVDDQQLEDCFPESERGRHGLVLMTIGGNDLQKLRGGFDEGRSLDELWADTRLMMSRVREAVAWLKDPVRFPKGNDVVFTNLYEYTDATGNVTSCPAAAAAGYSDVPDPEFKDMVIWAMEEFMKIAVDHRADMVFLLESFCGHGYVRNDPAGVCYRGPNSELWFDATCIHPNPTGHSVIANLFLDVVLE